jgi:hypothetical protein
MAMYQLSTLSDDTIITHSHLMYENGVDTVYVHFERPSDDGFDSVRCRLPDYKWEVWEGSYSDEEMTVFEHMVRNGAHVFYQLAKTGGFDVADAV